MSGRLRAAQFEEQHGHLLRRELSQYSTARTLRRALEERRPSIRVSEGVLKVWFSKHTAPPGTVTVSSAAELEALYGDVVRALAASHASPYKLCRAMLAATPPVRVTDGIAKQWFPRFGPDV